MLTGKHWSEIDFGREVCSNFAVATRKEWLVTNGIGGYASGTVAGTLTRRYHGLLVAALSPPLGRTLLVAKIDEVATYLGVDSPLFTNQWGSGEIDAGGCRSLERFCLEGTTPVWTFACADALLEKRVWMQQGENTTYVHYHLRRGSAPLTLTAKILVNYRDYHGTTHGNGWNMHVAAVAYGLRVTAFAGAVPLYILSDRATTVPSHTWYQDFFLRVEQERGLEANEAHLYIGDFHLLMHPGESFSLVMSTRGEPTLDGAVAYAERQRYEQGLLRAHTQAPAWVQRLVLAADQFIVGRPTLGNSEGHTLIAGYPWFGDWGRDTMISLPGLTLTTARPYVARNILRTFARFLDRGMLPNRFPDSGEAPEYNTVDATLWYVEAIRAYYAATGDEELLRELFPALCEILDWHVRGTRYAIRVDPQDGLLYAGEVGVQLTWMDVKIEDWVVTPRIGKPVEVNALWYNALRNMAEFARCIGRGTEPYEARAEHVYGGFARFWNHSRNYCYDVIDGPEGDDPALRPNQLFAVSLAHPLLSARQQRAVVDTCARFLLTSHGLRSLAPHEEGYIGRYSGGARQRDSAYHQGTVWAWLIGPFIDAHLRVHRDPATAASFLRPLIHHLTDHGLGSISEIFDGEAPFAPQGCIAQAWSVAEVLRAWEILRQRDRAF